MELCSFDELFYQASTRTPYVVNEISESSEEDKKNFNKLIYTTYASDLLSNLPTCDCIEGSGIVGVHNIGVICPNCGTAVHSQIDQTLESIVWMRAPKEIHALINPTVWTMIVKKFTKSGFEIIRFLADRNYKTHVQKPALVTNIQADLQMRGIGRGYNSFVEHFDTIINYLFALKDFKPKKRKGFKAKKDAIDPLQILLHQQRNAVFSQHIPLINRALLVIEETNVGTYVDPIVVGAVDAIRTMVSIDSEIADNSIIVKENKTIKSISQLATFYDGQKKTTLAKKEGLLRKHVYGTRSHWSFRGVISSKTSRHNYDELELPWGMGCSVFRIHLMSKLIKRNFSPNEGIGLLNAHASAYHPLLDELFQEMIAEAPGGKIACVFQRNPSLERGSAQLMYITCVKIEVEIPTVSLSILSVKGFNADRPMLFIS